MGGLRVPAEWEPQERVFLCWPSHEEHWGQRLAGVQAFVRSLLEIVLEFQPATLILQPGTEPLVVEGRHPLECLEVSHNDIWIRDFGPWFAWRDGQRVCRDFRFNAWGEKFPPWDLDASFSLRLGQDQGWPREESPLILEGGAMEFNGEGLAITTRPCLVGPGRQDPFDEEATRQAIVEHLGLDHLLVLPEGLKGDHTDGHVDNLVRFLPGGRVLLPEASEGDANEEVVQDAQQRLLKWATEVVGVDLKLLCLPSLPPKPLGNELLPLSYLNFIFLNGALLFPCFGVPQDAAARDVFEGLGLGLQVVAVDCSLLVEEGGALHCMTRQMPGRG